MKGRTRLTTPPGEEPASEVSPEGTTERYVPGFALPEEPRVPARHRRRVIVLVVVLALAAGGYVVWRATTAGQFDDPALSDLLPGEGDDGGEGTPTGDPGS